LYFTASEVFGVSSTGVSDMWVCPSLMRVDFFGSAGVILQLWDNFPYGLH
jgi:hypothetical protein